MEAPDLRGPSWDRLFEDAVAQEGHFTTRQAADAGYSPQLLLKYTRNGRVVRVRRGVYRIVHYPAGEHEDLVALWLWSERAGVFSHETALMLHEISDALPSRVSMTLPATWSRRRLRVPEDVIIHHAQVTKNDRVEIGAIPVTSVRRTLLDCIDAHVSPELIEAGLRDAVHKELLSKQDERELRAHARRS